MLKLMIKIKDISSIEFHDSDCIIYTKYKNFIISDKLIIYSVEYGAEVKFENIDDILLNTESGYLLCYESRPDKIIL